MRFLSYLVTFLVMLPAVVLAKKPEFGDVVTIKESKNIQWPSRLAVVSSPANDDGKYFVIGLSKSGKKLLQYLVLCTDDDVTFSHPFDTTGQPDLTIYLNELKIKKGWLSPEAERNPPPNLPGSSHQSPVRRPARGTHDSRRPESPVTPSGNRQWHPYGRQASAGAGHATPPRAQRPNQRTNQSPTERYQNPPPMA